MIRLALFLLLLASDADSRDRNVPAAFQRLYPCPSTGKTTGACPGWERDHYIALVCGGPDTVENMNWMTVEDHKAKTKLDMKECRRK